MKFETRDGKKITIDSDALNDEIIELLNNTVPRLSYDEILDGELERRLSKTDLGPVKLSSGDDIKQLVFSLAMFNTLSKPTGL
jgi:hypothetical protein